MVSTRLFRCWSRYGKTNHLFPNYWAGIRIFKIFEAWKLFNIDAKEGKENIVWAEAVEDHEEKGEDEIDTNKIADVDGEKWK